MLRRRVPPLGRVLLVESGGRHLSEKLIPHFREAWKPDLEVDLVTCFAGLPASFGDGRVFRVSDYATPEARAALAQELRNRQYAVVAILCTAEPVMTKWKWWLAAKLPAKLLIVNENGDYFWFDRTNAAVIAKFVLYRAGLTGAGAAGAVARLVFFPFTLLYLISYAGWAHARRRIRNR